MWISGGCLVGVWRVSFGYLEGVMWVSGGCLVGVWRVSCGCLEGVKKESCGYTGCHSTMGSQFKY